MELHCLIHGVVTAEARLLPLRRLLFLFHHQSFSRTLFPQEPGIARGILQLRVGDAIAAGATPQEIALALFGQAVVEAERARSSDSLRSRVRRLVSEARELAKGGYRLLLQSSSGAREDHRNQ